MTFGASAGYLYCMEINRRSTLQIGPLSLETPILLAPMAGFTDLPFRMTLRPMGGLGFAYAEMMNPRSILIEKGRRRAQMLATSPEDRPLGHQIYGTDPQLIADAARWLQEHGAILVDINMGCPQREITSAFAGSALLRKPAEAVKLAEQVVNAVSIPVTVKMRLGWDESSIVAANLARDLEKVGVAAITVHGRTRSQGFKGEVNLQEIRRVVEAVERVPVIGNGNITSPVAALRMFQETGCAGIMVARGATRNPWLIRDIWRAMEELPPLPQPSQTDRLTLMRDHFERTILHYGEKHAVAIYRRWIAENARSLGWDRETMVHLLRINSIPDMRHILTKLAESSSQ